MTNSEKSQKTEGAGLASIPEQQPKPEIEIKCWLNEFPTDLPVKTQYEITQTYITVGEKTFRLRKRTNTGGEVEHWYNTKQRTGPNTNQETDIQISKEKYNQLLEQHQENIIGEVEKTRTLVVLENGLIAEIDIFEGNLTGLQLAEVEFPTEQDLKNFQKPSWMGKPVEQSNKDFSQMTPSQFNQWQENFQNKAWQHST